MRAPFTLWRLVAVLLSLGAVIAASPSAAARIKDLGSFQGVRPNQLVGYGIVVGLAGTGDDSLAYSTLGVSGVAANLGMTLPPGVNPALRNSAAVIVTAELPAFAKPGQALDVTVSALGNARSLRGGTLVLAPLRGADGQIYAIAQGNVVVGGLGVSAQDGSRLTVNVPSAGRVPAGATVEREVAADFAATPALTFNLAQDDLTTATLVANAINQALGSTAATAIDAVSISITAPPGAPARIALMSRIENLPITPAEAAARVVVNSRTGTVVINGAVRIERAAVSHGRLTVTVEEHPTPSQPAPFSGGSTVVVPDSQIIAEESHAPMFEMEPSASLTDIVRAVNAIGAGPSDLVAILEAMRQAGALHAELEIL